MSHKINCYNSDILTRSAHILLISALMLLSVLVITPTIQAEHILKSPDGNIVITFDVKDLGDQQGCLIYAVHYDNQPVIVDSHLGLAIKDAAPLDSDFDVIKTSRGSHDSTYSPVYAERKTIRDHYNQLAVDLKENRSPYRRLQLIFRAYNEGAALCYTLPRQNALKNVVISAEKTQFRFTGDHTAYAVYAAQGQYSKVPLSKLKNDCERPLTIQIDDKLFASVAEARLVDYARMRLSPDESQPHTLVSSLAGEVNATLPLTTPWRVIMLGRRPGDLLERNYLILNLNEPCAIEDTSWIKPGKVIREVTLTTAGGKACIDFAVEHNLQYVEFDAGWYGHEYSDEADARTISVDPKRSKGPLDLHSVIDYARRRGIGILLYVNRRALERQLNEILPLYEKWGVKGVKYGFVQVGSQQWTTWLHEAVRMAAEHHLMVDIHDEYRPTGCSRTYPNLMTQEGIRGNECMPTADENLILPFTRMLCGAGDYTICYYSSRIKTTHAHQLAASVVFYSPWQFLFWYDRPDKYRGEPEIELFEHLPVVWDETRVIDGKIGEYITIARKSGDEWYVGSMNGLERRRLEIPLAFLDENRLYVAHVYSDTGSDDQTRTQVQINRYLVDSSVILTAQIPPSGGQAIRLHHATANDLKKYPKFK